MAERRSVRSWQTESDSDPGKRYETVLWSDGDLSCDCRGWTIKRAGTERTCKHVREYRRVLDLGGRMLRHTIQPTAPVNLPVTTGTGRASVVFDGEV